MLPENSLDPTRPDAPSSLFVNSAAQWTRYITHAWAAMMYAFTRRSFGRNFFNFWGMSGLFVLSFWAWVTTAREDAVPLSAMMAAFVLLCIWHRRHSPQDPNGEIPHTRYIGWPLICDVLPISEQVAKSFVEPGVVFMIGFGIEQLHHSLGLFIMLGAGASLLDWIYLSRRDYCRASRMHNAEKEHQLTMKTYDRYFGK